MAYSLVSILKTIIVPRHIKKKKKEHIYKKNGSHYNEIYLVTE